MPNTLNSISRQWLLCLLVCCLFLCAIPQNRAIAEQRTLTILRDNQNHPPYEMHVRGHLTGFHVELIKSVAQQMDIKVQFDSVPWARAVEMLEHGQADAITYFTRTQQREHFAIYHAGNIISYSSHYLVHHKDHPLQQPVLNDLQQLSGKLIGVEHGFSYGEAFDNADFIKKMVIKNSQQMLALLKNKRIDFALIEDEDYYRMRDNPAFSSLQAVPVPFDQEANYLAFARNRGHQQLAQQFAEAMQSFKQTTQYHQLAQRYPQVAPAAAPQVCGKSSHNASQC